MEKNINRTEKLNIEVDGGTDYTSFIEIQKSEFKGQCGEIEILINQRDGKKYEEATILLNKIEIIEVIAFLERQVTKMK